MVVWYYHTANLPDNAMALMIYIDVSSEPFIYWLIGATKPEHNSSLVLEYNGGLLEN